MKPEPNETALDEAKETPEMQAQEMESGEEMHTDGSPVSEEFRAMCEDIVKTATEDQIEYLQSLLSMRKSELSDSTDITTDDFDKVKRGDDE